ncbi:hypothetical protein ABH922_005126 [Rhodococcus sp. 27YEA15]|uniref:hypothetical protein n=1 Tax=Rhodococcus sp. 27YEA15 TaxID=3156259 RepID=UPI003C7D7776
MLTLFLLSLGTVAQAGVLTSLTAAVVFGGWKLATYLRSQRHRKATIRHATELLRARRPSDEDRWGFADWDWALAEIAAHGRTPGART